MKASKKGVSKTRNAPSKSQEMTATRERLKELNESKRYIFREQEELEGKIGRLRSINGELGSEYNALHERGKELYNAYFELYYALKLKSQTKFFKFPVRDEDMGVMKRFNQFSKVDVRGRQAQGENPMMRVLRVKSGKERRMLSNKEMTVSCLVEKGSKSQFP